MWMDEENKGAMQKETKREGKKRKKEKTEASWRGVWRECEIYALLKTQKFPGITLCSG